MESPFGLKYEQLLDPEFLKKFQQGYAKGEAMGRTIAQTPLQPEVTAQDIQPEPMYVEPQSTTYTGFKDQASIEPSIYDQMQASTSPKEQQKLLYQLMSKSMEQQQAAATQAQEAFKKEQERQAKMSALQKIDLRPFAEALKGYGSTSVAEAQAPEMTEMQRQELLRKLQSQAAEAQQGVTKEQVAALKSFQDKKDMQALLSQGNQEMRAFEAVQRKFDKPEQGMIDFYQSFDNFKGALDMGTTEAIQAATAAFARLSGEKGPLSDTDIQKVIPDNLKLKWAMYRQKILSGGATPAPQEIIDALRKNLGNLKDSAEKKYQTQLLIAKNQASKGPGSYKKYASDIYDEGLKILRPAEQAGASVNKQKPVLPTKDINSMSKEELKAYLGE